MPKHGLVKMKKIIPKGSEDASDALNDMFDQMTGSQNADPEIIIPKFIRLRELISKFIKIYTLLLNFNDFIHKFEEYKKEFDEIKDFIKKLQDNLDNKEITEDNLKSMSSDQVNTLYKNLKSKQEIQAIIVTSGNLGKHKRYLEDKNNLKDEFIKREPGLSLTPLSFTNLDIKLLWGSDKLTNMAKNYILNILNHTYLIGCDIYDVITSPDIDIKKFSYVLIKNIEKMKKQIPRCDKAFNIIKNSVEMLENNFKGYYRNSVECENPSIIVESFIIDVSMSQKASASITGQFRKIIMHMKRASANNNDPRIKKLFKILNSQFTMMERQTGIEPVDDDKETNKDKSDGTKNTNEDDKETNNINEINKAFTTIMGLNDDNDEPSKSIDDKETQEETNNEVKNVN